MRKSGYDEQDALKKLQMKTAPHSCFDNCNYLQDTCKKSALIKFKGFAVEQQQGCHSNYSILAFQGDICCTWLYLSEAVGLILWC